MSTTRVDRLPPEVWSFVCEYLPQKDLRNLRLASKYIQPSAASTLFRTVYLKVSLNSFEKLEYISEKQHLSVHVRHIQYDGKTSNWWDAQALEGGQRIWAEYISCELKPYYSQLDRYQQHQAYISSFAQSSDCSYMLRQDHDKKMFCQYLKQFPGLCSVFYDNKDESEIGHDITTRSEFQALPTTLQRSWLELYCDTEGQDRFWNLIEAGATTKFGLSNLTGNNFFWWKWIRRANLSADVCRHLKDLRRFELEFYHNPCRVTQDTLKTFESLLAQLSALEQLRISFRRLPFDCPEYSDIIDLSHYNGLILPALIPKHRIWPQLRTLSLEAFYTPISFLETFLISHSQSLRSLKLAHIRFIRDVGQWNDPDASWIVFLTFLRENLTLQNIELEGVLTNGYDEAWLTYKHYADDENCMRYKVQRYIMNSGPCPFRSKGEVDPADVGKVALPTAAIYNKWEWEEDKSWYCDEHALHNFD